MRVAIAAENDDYDGEIYRVLLARVLGTEIERFHPEIRFSGLWSVIKAAEPFLRRAQANDVRHALFAVDNDGGARRHPEHAPEHDGAREAADSDGCRVCRLDMTLPRWWLAEGHRQCIVIPVQTIET
jgi:hypothetical protein